MTDVSMAVSGGSVPEPVLQVPTLITSSRYFMKVFDVYAVFKRVYLIILNEEKGGTCEAKLKLKDSMEAILMKS